MKTFTQTGFLTVLLAGFFPSVFPASVAAANHAASDHQHASHSHKEGAVAGVEHKHEATHNLEAHTHGVAFLQLAAYENELMVSFRSAAHNFLGFEHEPKTPEEKAVLADVKKTLREHKNWLVLSGGGCEMTDITVHVGELSGDESGHADLEVDAFFRCIQARDVRTAQMSLFKAYPSIEVVNVQWILSDRQGSTELKPSKPLLTLN